MNPYAILISILILTIVIIYFLYNQYNSGKSDMIDELYKNNEITEDVYKKYKLN